MHDCVSRNDGVSSARTTSTWLYRLRVANRTRRSSIRLAPV